MPKNPDPNKFVLKVRKGVPILVDKQIERWRKYRKQHMQKVDRSRPDAPEASPLNERRILNPFAPREDE
jgi:hypothetical protein